MRRWLDSCAEARSPIRSRLTGTDVPTSTGRRSRQLQHRGRLCAGPGGSGRPLRLAVDVLLVLWVLSFGAAGFFRGLAAQMLSFVGIVAGVIAGAALAPHVLAGGDDSTWVPLASFVGASVGAVAFGPGGWAPRGRRARSRLARPCAPPRRPDQARWPEGWSGSRLHGPPPSSSSTNPHSGCGRNPTFGASRRARRAVPPEPCSEPSSASIRCPSCRSSPGRLPPP